MASRLGGDAVKPGRRRRHQHRPRDWRTGHAAAALSAAEEVEGGFDRPRLHVGDADSHVARHAPSQTRGPAARRRQERGSRRQRHGLLLLGDVRSSTSVRMRPASVPAKPQPWTVQRATSAAQEPERTEQAESARLSRWVADTQRMMELMDVQEEMYNDTVYRAARGHFRRVALSKAMKVLVERTHLARCLRRVESIRLRNVNRQRLRNWARETTSCRIHLRAAVVQLRRSALRRRHARATLDAVEARVAARLQLLALRNWFWEAQQDKIVREAQEMLSRASLKRHFKVWIWLIRFEKRRTRALAVFAAILKRQTIRRWRSLPAGVLTDEQKRERRRRLLRQQFHSVWRGTSLDVAVSRWPYRKALRQWRDVVMFHRIETARIVVIRAWTTAQRAQYRQRVFRAIMAWLQECRRQREDEAKQKQALAVATKFRMAARQSKAKRRAVAKRKPWLQRPVRRPAAQSMLQRESVEQEELSERVADALAELRKLGISVDDAEITNTNE